MVSKTRWIAEGGAKDAAVTSPIDRRITLCVLVAIAPAGIVLGANPRWIAEGGAKDAAVTYQLDLPVIHCVTLAIEDSYFTFSNWFICNFSMLL